MPRQLAVGVDTVCITSVMSLSLAGVLKGPVILRPAFRPDIKAVEISSLSFADFGPIPLSELVLSLSLMFDRIG